MKKLLPLLILLCLSFGAKASHLMGGEIVVKHLSGSDYEIRLTHYRDTLGINLISSTPIYVYSWDTAMNMYNTFYSNNVPRNTMFSIPLLPSFPYGVEVGVYIDTVSLTAGTKYRITNHNCCRNHAIKNMASPGTEAMALYTEIEIPATGVNNSPDFLLMPVSFFPVNTAISYNPLPYDLDNDSLTWNLNVPYATANSTGLITVAGFVPPSADTSGPFTMNPSTGEITWTPDQVGNFVQSFEVKEYRNGVQTGSIIRDYQYVVINAPVTNPSMPFITTASSSVKYNNAEGFYYLNYAPDYELVFELTGEDADDSTTLTMTSNSTIFQLDDPATFTTSTTDDQINGTLRWTPPTDFDEEVIIVFRLRDGLWTTDYTLKLIPSPLSVDNPNQSITGLQIYPNPTASGFTLSLENKESANTQIEIYNTLGQKVAEIFQGELPKGTWELRYDEPLITGHYFISVRSEGEATQTLPLTVE